MNRKELDEAFRRFCNQAESFSREVYAGFPPSLRIGNAEANLRISRTVFAKWSLDILVALHSEPLGFERLRKAVGSVSPRVLSSKLLALERRGLIRRRVVKSRPPKTLYSLTRQGVIVTRLGEPVFLYLRSRDGTLYKLP